MATCPNCNKKLSCGCQKRKASNGKMVCVNCLGSYEKKTSGSVSNTQLSSDDLNSAITQFNTLKDNIK